MADKIYVVTLKKKDDLDGFYSDMESDGFKLQLKRPISRNTHYYIPVIIDSDEECRLPGPLQMFIQKRSTKY